MDIRGVTQDIRFSLFALVLIVCGCDSASQADVPPNPHAGALDSAAMSIELRASTTGAAPPKQQSYSYRGLHAGMNRTELETRIGARPERCDSLRAPPPAFTCTYEASVPPDGARLSLDVTYLTLPAAQAPTAVEIAVTRELPLAVDGVQLAQHLADAFEKQTSLLDSRDATFGHHTATVRMGTTSHSPQNFVALSVTPQKGREELGVRLRRGTLPQAHPAPPKQIAPGR